MAILVSFLCSILEAVILSITPSYVETINQKNPQLGAKMKALKEDIDRPLSAILSLNTIAHTIGAAGVGWQSGQVFKSELALGLVPVVLTLLILILSEIIPKSIGANYWRTLAPYTARVLSFLITVLWPLVWLSQSITRMLARDKSAASISRAEISAMADIGHKEGIFEEGESRVIKNLLRFKQVKIEEVMTPRTVVLAASQEDTVRTIYENADYLRFTRIPIYEEQIDNVTGFVHKHDVLYKMARDEHNLKLKEIKRDLMAVSEKMPVPNLFERLIDEREHIALAVDEYGGVAGIVTMEDVLETLLGIEILDEFDKNKDMRAYAKQKWAQKAKELDINPEKPGDSSSETSS